MRAHALIASPDRAFPFHASCWARLGNWAGTTLPSYILKDAAPSSIWPISSPLTLFFPDPLPSFTVSLTSSVPLQQQLEPTALSLHSSPPLQRIVAITSILLPATSIRPSLALPVSTSSNDHGLSLSLALINLQPDITATLPPPQPSIDHPIDN